VLIEQPGVHGDRAGDAKALLALNSEGILGTSLYVRHWKQGESIMTLKSGQERVSVWPSQWTLDNQRKEKEAQMGAPNPNVLNPQILALKIMSAIIEAMITVIAHLPTGNHGIFLYACQLRSASTRRLVLTAIPDVPDEQRAEWRRNAQNQAIPFIDRSNKGRYFGVVKMDDFIISVFGMELGKANQAIAVLGAMKLGMTKERAIEIATEWENDFLLELLREID